MFHFSSVFFIYPLTPRKETKTRSILIASNDVSSIWWKRQQRSLDKPHWANGNKNSPIIPMLFASAEPPCTSHSGCSMSQLHSRILLRLWHMFWEGFSNRPGQLGPHVLLSIPPSLQPNLSSHFSSLRHSPAHPLWCWMFARWEAERLHTAGSTIKAAWKE